MSKWQATRSAFARRRPATPGDITLLREWDERPHLQASDPDSDWEWETELLRTPAWRQQLIAELDGTPIGFVQIIDPHLEDSHYWGDCQPNLRAIDIWIGEPDLLGQGFGTRMMQQALAMCFANPAVTAVLVDPMADNDRAHRFSRRCGLEFVERRAFGDDECHVYCLERTIYERASG